MRNIYLLSVLLLVSSCGLFQPRESFETPDVSTNADRFSFSSIIDLAGKKISWINYETFFSDSLLYQDMLTNITSNKNKIIDRLQKLEHNYPRFQIKWKNIDVVLEENTLNIKNVSYIVIADSTSLTSDTFSGKSTMKIIMDVDYKLVTWQDFPDDLLKKFFTPVE